MQRKADRLGLSSWILRHPHLRPVTGDVGEPSVLLLLLWEEDQGRLYPSKSPDLSRRLSKLSQDLEAAVAADADLRAQLSFKRVRRRLTWALPRTTHIHWNVQLNFASVGEPFRQRWKAHLSDLVTKAYTLQVERLHAVPALALPAPPVRAPPKRPREAPAPRLQVHTSRQLQAAHALPAVKVAGRRYCPAPPPLVARGAPPSVSDALAGSQSVSERSASRRRSGKRNLVAVASRRPSSPTAPT